MILYIFSAILLTSGLIIGKTKGLKTFLSLLFNLIILVLSLMLINIGFNLYIILYLAVLSIISIIIFFLNGYNNKTKAAFISVIIVMIILSILIAYFNQKLHLGGFSYEQVDEISAYSFNIALDLNKIYFMVLLFISVGSISDTAVAISSAIYEINKNASLDKKSLFTSGMNVGKDIIGTTINTLFFTFISGFLGYILWHNYDNFTTIINFNGFASEVTEILIAALGCLIIIPITSIISIQFFKNKTK